MEMVEPPGEGERRSNRRRRALHSLIALALAPVLAVLLLGGLEFGVRQFFPQDLRGFSIEGDSFNWRDPTRGMRLMPGARWRFEHPEYEVEYTINADGLRDKTRHAIPKPPGQLRVLLVGDSFTFGQGVRYRESWPVLVESHLQGDPSLRSIELVKAGIPGHDTRAELIHMEELRSYDYDAVVVGFLVNDLYSNSLDGFGGSAAEAELAEQPDVAAVARPGPGSESWIQRLRWKLFTDARQNSHLLTLVTRAAIVSDQVYCALYQQAPERGEFFSVPLGRRAAEAWGVTRTLLQRMVEFSRSEGVKLIVFSLPQQSQVLCGKARSDGDRIDVAVYDRLLRKLGREEGFEVVAPLGDFQQAYAEGKDLFFSLDGHFTALGHQLAAQVFLRDVVPLLVARDGDGDSREPLEESAAGLEPAGTIEPSPPS